MFSLKKVNKKKRMPFNKKHGICRKRLRMFPITHHIESHNQIISLSGWLSNAYSTSNRLLEATSIQRSSEGFKGNGKVKSCAAGCATGKAECAFVPPFLAWEEFTASRPKAF